MRKLVLLLLVILVASMAKAQQHWGLDSCFGTDGIVITDLGQNHDYGNSVHIQEDGKIVGTGQSNNGGQSSSSFALIRYNSDGSLDESFGSNGFVLTPNGASEASILQPDQKIILSGYHGTDLLSSTAFALLRYNANGSLDPSFGTNGKVATSFGNFIHRGTGVVVQPDGKIVQSGSLRNEVTKFILLRFETDGTPDSTFGEDGRVTIDVPDFGATHTLVCQTDGKLIVGGRLRNGSSMDFVMMRYDSNGTIDPTFGTNGVVFTDVGGHNESEACIKLLPSGKILLTGRVDLSGETRDFWLLRYNSDGSLDNTFATNGIARTDLGHDDISILTIPLSSGKIIVGGWTYPDATEKNIGIVRYNENGSVDSTFGTDGIIITSASDNPDYCWWGAEQNDGKFVLFGATDGLPAPPFNRNFLILRYSTEGCGISGIDNPVSTEELFKFYPNPASENLHIEYNQKLTQGSISLTIIDALGQTVSSHQLISKKSTLDIGELKSGIYLISVTDGSYSLSRRLVVE